MSQQFKNMSELVEYLDGLEKRVRFLEEENARLQAIPQPKNTQVDKNAITQYLSNRFPKTNLLSPKFFSRAFAVWGHFFMANLVISLIFSLIYFCLVAIGLVTFWGLHLNKSHRIYDKVNVAELCS
jgi:hypothetical protein